MAMERNRQRVGRWASTMDDEWNWHSKQPHLIIGLGELLWDVLPSGPRLGGAPANFSVMAGRLGNHATILSRIGRDDFGRQAMEFLDPLPVDAGLVQVDPAHDSGLVTVELDGGQPRYTIHEAVAWDFLELSDEWVRAAERADVICFGSLAQRCRISRQTIQTLVAETSSACIRIFDVNLRSPFYSGEVLEESLELATVVKMNDAEVPVVMNLLGLPCESGSDQDWLVVSAQRLLEGFPALQMAAVTRGAAGSLLVKREEWHEHPGVAAEVADTVGAGDAFTAALAHSMLRGANLAAMNEAGNRWGAWVASQPGAMPGLPDDAR